MVWGKKLFLSPAPSGLFLIDSQQFSTAQAEAFPRFSFLSFFFFVSGKLVFGNRLERTVTQWGPVLNGENHRLPLEPSAGTALAEGLHSIPPRPPRPTPLSASLPDT